MMVGEIQRGGKIKKKYGERVSDIVVIYEA